MIAAFSCSEDSELGPGETPVIEFLSVRMPDTVWTGTSYTFQVEAELSGKNDFLPATGMFFVSMSVVQGGFSFAADLTDDGSAPDNVSGDFIFTNRIPSGAFSGVTGTVTVEFSIGETQPAKISEPALPYLIGDNYSTTVTVFNSVKNMPPYISGFSGIGTELVLDAAPSTLLSIDVSEPDGAADIASVTGYVYYPNRAAPSDTLVFTDDGSLSGDIAGDSIYTSDLDHAPMLAFGTGTYTIRIEAKDSYGNLSNEMVHTFDAIIGFVDHPPQIVQIIAPDSVLLDTVDGNLVLLQVAVADSNGLNDIKSVYTIFSASQSQQPNYMYDDGGESSVSGDLVKDDGIYSITFYFPPNAPLNSYYFTFYVLDNALNLTSRVHPFVVY